MVFDIPSFLYSGFPVHSITPLSNFKRTSNISRELPDDHVVNFSLANYVSLTAKGLQEELIWTE